MKKKTYERPSMKVYPMEPAKIICASKDEFGYIPGMPKDEKHLA